MKNKITILFNSLNINESRVFYDYLIELIETHIIDKGIIDKVNTELKSNIN